MHTFLLIITFFLGSILMSFFGVLVYRMPVIMAWREATRPYPKNIFSRSRCESCDKIIPFIFIIPLIGFILCKGKCFFCKEKIHIIYPIMEFIGGIVFLVFYIWLGLSGIISSILVVILVFISWLDLNECWIPQVVSIPLFWIGLCFSPYQINADARIMGAALGFFVSYLSMEITSYIKNNDVVAGGDIALITCAGAWLGLEVMPKLLILISIIFIIHAVPYRIKGKMYVPMGPAICIGFVICIVQQLIS